MSEDYARHIWVTTDDHRFVRRSEIETCRYYRKDDRYRFHFKTKSGQGYKRSFESREGLEEYVDNIGGLPDLPKRLPDDTTDVDTIQDAMGQGGP